MRKLLFLLILYSLFFIHYSNPNPALAQSVNITGPTPTGNAVNGVVVPSSNGGNWIIYPGNVPVNVTASVGEVIVNVSGLASPNASVVLSDSSGQFLRSTVADNQGYFYLSQVNMKTNTSSFCLDTVDFRRLGKSLACLDFAAISTNQNFENIYLPPTIGLYQKQINAGQEALAYGLSMPGAQVTVKIQSQIVNVATDTSGYYEYRYNKVPAGTYKLSATGTFQNKPSLEPKNSATLTALSIPGQIAKTAGQIGKDIFTLLTTSIFGFFLLLFILIAIIIVLLLLLHHGGMAFIKDKFKHVKPLHLDWLLEFEEKSGEAGSRSAGN